MNDWTHGYVADVNYDYGFFPELAPTSLVFNLLDDRLLPPSLERFTYCELGCGQGFTTNLLAATNPQGEFWGVDFNPSHIVEAQRLATAAQLPNITFSDHSFAEFLKEETPKFDFIALHGVYAWVGDENRQILVELLRQKLTVGGVVYISYNTLPGWSAVMPLREFMVQCAEGIAGSSVQKVETGLAVAKQLQDLQAKYFLENPTVKHDFAEMQEDSRSYLAHEYFGGDWRPLYHAEVAKQLSQAKLTFATSAEIDDQFYNLKLNDQQLTFLSQIAEPTLRETARDFLFNTRFRKDLFVKGPVKLSALEQVELLSNLRFALLVAPEEIEYEVDLVGQPIKLDEAIYQPIVEALAQQPQTLRSLMRDPALATMGFSSILQALKILMATYSVFPALPEEGEDDRRQAVAGLNEAILRRARFGSDTQVLASPITGSGIEVSRAHQLFLLAYLRGVDPIDFIWNILQVQGEQLIKDGQVLESLEANQAELKEQAQQFMEEELPLLTRLGLV